jgi:hypothetical protein
MDLIEDNESPDLGVVECLIDMERSTVVYGTTRVDNTEAISLELATNQRGKAFPFNVHFCKPGSVYSQPAYNPDF